MKKYFKIIILILVTIPVLSGTIAAQKESQNQGPTQKIFEAQLTEIKNQLKLSESQEMRLETVLRSYHNEMNVARKLQVMRKKEYSDTLSDVTAERIILGQIYAGRYMLQIREKYYFEMKKFISPVDIMKIFKIEQDVYHKVMSEYNRRKE
jgi:exonuclease VII small subunit